MLTQLSISNLAIVEDAKIDFQQGLNVLTGETGAGKSILIGAISLLAGKKASKESVRSGFEQAYVEGVIELAVDSSAWAFLENAGIVADESYVIIKRLIQADGKNKVLINQQATTVQTLSLFSEFWLDLTGQHAQQKFLDPMVQLDIVDQAGNHLDACKNYLQVFNHLKQKKKELARLQDQKKKALEEKEFLEFQYSDLKKANLKEGELEDLQNQYARVKYAQEISTNLEKIQSLVSEDKGLLDQSDLVLKALDKLSRYETSLDGFKDQVENAKAVFRDLSDTVMRNSSSKGSVEMDSDQLNERISFLQGLAKKYGSIENAIHKRDDLKNLLSLAGEESEVEVQLCAEIEGLEKQTVDFAKKLTQMRKKIATDLSKSITQEVQYLGMSHAHIQIGLVPWSADDATLEINKKYFHPSGAEKINFDFSPNVGEGFRPLASIASGGELSRVLLAVKSIAIQKTGSKDKTYLFDEVDSGVGGQTAERIGQRMRFLASHQTQVLNVTHLAQVAAYADHHLKIEKKSKTGRTFTKVTFLDKQLRKEELARMIGGIELTKKTYAFADELLEKSLTSFINKGQI